MKYKFVVTVTLDRPYINMKPAVLSTLRTEHGKESRRKMQYQKDEKEVFADAGIVLTEIVDERILRSQTIDCNGVLLTKISDKIFEFETARHDNLAIANREAVDMLDTATDCLESQGYIITDTEKTKCESEKCELKGKKENLEQFSELAQNS